MNNQLTNKFKLLSNADNLMSFPESTIESYSISADQKDALTSSLSIYLKKNKNHFSWDVVLKQLDNNLSNFDIVYMQKYPLPVSYNKNTKRGLINLSIFHKRDVLNIEPRDLYTIIFHGYISAVYITIPIQKNLISVICDYMCAVFLKVFAKKYGLIGSYSEEIPKLRFLVNMYTLQTFFGITGKNATAVAANLSKATLKDFNQHDIINHNFTDIVSLISILSQTDILKGLSLYEFVSTMVNRLFMHNIVMFEDPMRFMAILAGSTINSNVIFPSSLQFYHRQLYNDIINNIDRVIN